MLVNVVIVPSYTRWYSRSVNNRRPDLGGSLSVGYLILDKGTRALLFIGTGSLGVPEAYEK